MVHKARMIATDLDGTLLSPDSTVSPRTLAAINRAREAGLIITFVTGRPPRWLAPVIHQTGWHGLAVAANGAALIDLEHQRVEDTFPIPTADMLNAVEAIRRLLPGASFAVEYANVGSALPLIDPQDPHAPAEFEDAGAPHAFGHEPAYRGVTMKLPWMPNTAPVETLIHAGDVVKLLARGPADSVSDPDMTMHAIAEELSGTVAVTHSTTKAVLLEMSRHDISKATGLAAIAAHHGIARADIVAIGDMPNDLPMLEWAGRGLAVANAHPRVLATVGTGSVIGANSDDGVAKLIEEVIEASD